MKHSHGSALALLLLTGFWFAPGSSPAGAHADEPSANPALDACQRLASQRYRQVSPERFVSVRLLEEDVNQEKYEGKVGSQPVGFVLSGRGVWQDKTDGPSNVRFVCLLESSEKPVFAA